MDMADRIRELRKKAGMSQEELGNKLGIGKSAIAKYENGRVKNIPLDKVKAICKIFGVSYNTLLDGNWKSYAKEIQDDFAASVLEPIVLPEMIPIPVLGCIHAGNPVTAQECVEDTPVYIPKDWTTSGQLYRGLRVKGNSMLPKIQDGDRVIFRVTPECNSGDIVIARIDGDDATVKKIVRSSGSIILQPLNPSYSPLVFTGDEAEPTLEILGVVVQLVRDI